MSMFTNGMVRLVDGGDVPAPRKRNGGDWPHKRSGGDWPRKCSGDVATLRNGGDWPRKRNGGDWPRKRSGDVTTLRKHNGGDWPRKRSGDVPEPPLRKIVPSYAELEAELPALGWESYYEDPAALYKFHKCGSPDLIALPADFAIIKNRESFGVVVV